MLKEQNALYKSLVVEHAGAVREAEGQRDRALEQNRARPLPLCSLLRTLPTPYAIRRSPP